MLLDIIGIGTALIDKIIPDQESRAQAKHDLMMLQMNGEFKHLESRMSAIIAEAKSSDPWTSRARPSFLYVFYAVILTMTVLAPLLGVFFPEGVTRFYDGVGRGFAAVPDTMWTTFTIGYLGYAGARSFDKNRILKEQR